nr:hypothetical protein [Tanacetum cinerariifolium]
MVKRGKEVATDLNSSSGDKDHNEDSESEVEETYNEYDELISGSNESKERRVLYSDLDTYLGSSSMNSAMLDFKDCVSNIEVVDINSSGIHYTWNQNPKGRDGMLKKLDHIMGNLEFSNNFQGAYAIFQPYRISDHSPAILKIPSLSLTNLKPFKFCNFLSHKGNSLEVVSEGWNTTVDGHSMFQVTQKMKKLKKPFRKMVHDQGNLHKRVNHLRIKLDEIQKAIDRDPANGSLRDEEATYIKAFNEAKIDEERFLRQKAKIDWLEVGDSNSAYFHKSIKYRNQRSRIDVVITSNNVVVTSLCVADVFVSHYESFIGANMESDLDVFQKF